MTKKLDLTDMRFGRLVAIKEVESYVSPKGYKLSRWLCKCDCGNIITVNTQALRSGNTMSCKCLHKELLSKRRSKGHESRSRLYSIWNGMKHRCFSENARCYARYGGRGINICDEWIGENGFQNFKYWAINNGYSDELTLERVDNDGNYCPDNCTWATHEQQANNMSTNNRITVHGETHTIAEWSKITGLNRKTIWRRRYIYHLPEDILFTHSTREVMNARKSIQNNSKRESDEGFRRVL